MPEERLQKILARAGLGSRRASEELIASGRVRVNGKVAALGMKADPLTDRIEVDGRPVASPEPLTYIALYKPRGVISAATSPDPRPTVRDLVPVPGRLYPVGRLDVDSEGLILMTNDGALANRLTHPRFGHEKEYRVLVARHPDEEQIETWRRGVVMADGYHTQPADVRVESHFGKGTWLRVILREGRKRQIRETGEQIGLPVAKIIRVRIGSLLLGNLKPREWRHLTDEEVSGLKSSTVKGVTKRGPGRTNTRKARQRPSRRNRPEKNGGESSHSRRGTEKGRRR